VLIQSNFQKTFFTLLGFTFILQKPNANHFYKEIDGILGLGFNYSYYLKQTSTYSQSILSTLSSDYYIEDNIFSIYINENGNGTLTIGGWDKGKVERKFIYWVGIANPMASYEWGVPINSINGIKLEENSVAFVDTVIETIIFPKSVEAEFYKNIGLEECGPNKQYTICSCKGVEKYPDLLLDLGGYLFTFKFKKLCRI